MLVASSMGAIWTIYCHIHVGSGRRYVGLTKKTMLFRWNRHVYDAAKSRYLRNHFHNAIRKYGKEAFSHEVLETCETLEAANAAEILWIAHLDTTDPEKGFNLNSGGSHTPHPVRNVMKRPDVRAKCVAALARLNASTTPKQRSARTKKLWEDPSFRNMASVAIRKATFDPEVRSAAVSKMKRTKALPEVKARASEVSSALWKDLSFRARNAALWSDPAFRSRCESGLRRGASLNSAKTHCRNGHEYVPENTYVNPRGSRECRICARERGRVNMRAAYFREKEAHQSLHGR